MIRQQLQDKEVNDFMRYGCYGTGFQRARSYLTKEECISLLKEYKDEREEEGSRGSRKDQWTRSKLI